MLTPADIADGVLQGQRAMLARAITLAESSLPHHRVMAEEVLERCLPHTGNANRIGITGVPGAGKSTFIDALGMHLGNERGESVAVLAVDPSSPITGGSILGDKTRMPRLANSPLAYIRPSPSGGSLGGVARSTRQSILLCEAAGFRNVFVETVGVGQSEVAVAGMTDFFLLLLIPGGGDELQGIKRGIMEMLDLLVINKADGDNVARAEQARNDYHNALHLFAPPVHGWTPRVITCSALHNKGLAHVWDVIHEHRTLLEANGWLQSRRREQALKWMFELIEDALRRQFLAHEPVRRELPHVEEAVREGRLSAFRAARRLLEYHDQNFC